MGWKKWLITFACVLLCAAVVAEPRELRVNQTKHPLDEYAVGALKIALAALPGEFKLVLSNDEMTQGRAIEVLEAGEMDVMWLASNTEAEERLTPIRFPLLKGLLGHRICIINPLNQSKFNEVHSLDDVKRMSFGQGQGWPDVDILRSNDLKVITYSKYNNLFYMVEGGRFDGFPRGVMEPWSEIASRPELGLVVDTQLALVYKLPFYLFVAKGEEALAKRLHQGFEIALADGTFDEYFFRHPMVIDALERSNLKNRIAFNLSNPGLHPKTPLDRADYWLDLKSL